MVVILAKFEPTNRAHVNGLAMADIFFRSKKGSLSGSAEELVSRSTFEEA